MRTATLLGLLLSLVGCGNFVTGSGRAVEQQRVVAAFSAIEVDDEIQATVTVGPAASVQLRGDDNVVPLVVTEVQGSRLLVHLPPVTNVSSDLGIRLTVTVPSLVAATADGASSVVVSGDATGLRALSASGGGVVRASGIAGPTLAVSASGSARVIASGAAADLALDASGSSSIALGDLTADRARVDVSGSSEVSVRLSTALRGQASGASRIHVRGPASTRDLSLSGASTVDSAP